MINFTCIQCPRGCSLRVEEQNHTYYVSGNFCPKGKEYALSEVIHPTRILTTTVRMKNGMLPVKTDKPVDKNKIFSVMKSINAIQITAETVKIGDIIQENIDGEGSNLVATANR